MTPLEWALQLDHVGLLKTAAAVLLVVCLQLYLNSRRGLQQAARDVVPKVHADKPVAAAQQQPEVPPAPAAETYERGGLVKQVAPGPKPQEPPGASAHLLPQVCPTTAPGITLYYSSVTGAPLVVLQGVPATCICNSTTKPKV